MTADSGDPLPDGTGEFGRHPATAATGRIEKSSSGQKLGLSLILAGALLIVGWHGSSWSVSRGIGDALFLFASFLTACYTVVLQRARLDPVHAAALVSVGSLVIYAPVYLALRGFHLAGVSLNGLITQVIFQGIVVTIISLILYARAVAILGASISGQPAFFVHGEPCPAPRNVPFWLAGTRFSIVRVSRRLECSREDWL